MFRYLLGCPRLWQITMISYHNLGHSSICIWWPWLVFRTRFIASHFVATFCLFSFTKDVRPGQLRMQVCISVLRKWCNCTFCFVIGQLIYVSNLSLSCVKNLLPVWHAEYSEQQEQPEKGKTEGEDTEAWNELGVVTGASGSICTSFFIYAGQQTLLLA